MVLSIPHCQGSVAALKKKTHRDMKELQNELEKTKQWVILKEKGIPSKIIIAQNFAGQLISFDNLHSH